MTTLTSRFGWSMPDPGGSPNTWGDTLNQTTGKIDEQVFQNTQAAVPIGTVVMFAGAVAPPNWMICDARSLDRVTYQPLFAVIGTYFGAPDSTHFNIPGLVNKQAIGANGAASLGTAGGAASVTLSAGNLPQHAHTIPDPQHYHTITDQAHGHTASQPAHTHGDQGHWHDPSGSYQDVHDHGLTRNPVSNVAGGNAAAGSGWAFTSVRTDAQQPALHISIGAGYANLANAQPAITVVNSGSNIHNTDYGLTRITTTDLGGGAASPAAFSTWSPYTQLNFIIRYI